MRRSELDRIWKKIRERDKAREKVGYLVKLAIDKG